METITYLESSKNFSYESDTLLISGNAGFDVQEDINNLQGTVYLKSEGGLQIASFVIKSWKEYNIITINEGNLDFMEIAIAGIKALIAKLTEKPSLEE